MKTLYIGLFCLMAVIPASAQDGSTGVVDRAEQRIKDLERRIAALEDVIQKLQTQIDQLESEQEQRSQGEPATVAARSATRNWHERENWRGLQQGMGVDQVEALLGDPEKIDVGPMLIYWHWGYPEGGSVHFDAQESKVLGWSEPRR